MDSIEGLKVWEIVWKSKVLACTSRLSECNNCVDLSEELITVEAVAALSCIRFNGLIAMPVEEEELLSR